MLTEHELNPKNKRAEKLNNDADRGPLIFGVHMRMWRKTTRELDFIGTLAEKNERNRL
jgi:hypothetical protein